jgi:hypothetical protein
MNLLHLLMGRGRVWLETTVLQGDKGMPIPALKLTIRNRWGSYREITMDSLSFLIITEKLLDAPEGVDFTYDQMHDTVPVKLTIPAFAVRMCKMEMGRLGPRVYEALKKADALTKSMLDAIPEEAKKSINLPVSPMARYMKLHAEVNGYNLEEASAPSETVH